MVCWANADDAPVTTHAASPAARMDFSAIGFILEIPRLRIFEELIRRKLYYFDPFMPQICTQYAL
jgi:hypothetical protein